MAYLERYNFTFNETIDRRNPTNLNDYEVKILEKDYTGSSEEILAVENPVQINYNNSNEKIFEPLNGSEATLNLIATEDFQLEDLYTEDELRWLVEIYRRKSDITVTWSLDETPAGIPFADLDLEIYVNGTRVVQKFTDDSGSFAAKKGDVIEVKIYAGIVPTSGIGGGNIEITGLPTQRTTTYPLSIDTTFTAQGNITITAYSTWSADTYTAIRSAIFYPACNSTEKIVFTKNYTSTTSQADAQALADADTNFNTEGQAYANANAICYDYTDLIWRGFIIPDGCQESFTFTPYTISVNAVDTLGLLKNLAYVQNSGDFWLGKQSFIEVIYNCLNRVQLPNINIYTCVNLYEDTYPTTDASDPLALTYVNAERFLNEDGIDPMNCDEVLKNVMHLWTAKIIQSEGDWYVFRPSELFFDGTQKFRKYVNGAFDSVVTKNVNQLLGGESEGLVLAPLFHTDTDQLKMIEKPYKNASISFKFGFVTSLLKNPKFEGWDGVNFTDWIKSTSTLPLSEDVDGGAKIGNMTAFPGPFEYIESITPALITGGDTLVFRMEYFYDASDAPRARVELNDGFTSYYLSQTGEWSSSEVFIEGISPIAIDGVVNIVSRRSPTSGELKIRLYEARLDISPVPTNSFITYKSVNVSPYLDAENPIGEKHTANQSGLYSFAPDTINVLNGDSSSQLYLSSLYKPDKVALTKDWYRKYASENILAQPFAARKELLRIAVEETQRMYARPFVKFDGSIFGYFNPLSRFSINDLEGLFIPLQLTYDLQANKVKATLARINDTEIEQDYELKPDYGTTTKVLVK